MTQPSFESYELRLRRAREEERNLDLKIERLTLEIRSAEQRRTQVWSNIEMLTMLALEAQPRDRRFPQPRV